MVSLYPENSIETIKVKLKSGETKIAKILCLGENGLIVWQSTLPYKAELLDDYAEYIPYRTINKFQIKNKVNLAPVGTGLAGAAVLGLLGLASGNIIALFGTVLVGAISVSVGVFTMIASIFLPKYRSADNFKIEDKLKIPYVKFIVDVPPELKAMIEVNDKKW